MVHRISVHFDCRKKYEQQNCNRTNSIMTLERSPDSVSVTEAIWTQVQDLSLSQPKSGHAIMVIPWTAAPAGCRKIP